MAIVTVTIPNAADNRYQTKIRLAIVTVRTSKSEPTLTKSSNVTLRSPERPRLVVIESRQRTFTKHAEHYFRIMNAANEGQLHRATRPPMSIQKWRRRKVPRWRVRCAPHQAIGSLIGMLGTGCLPEDLISRRLSLPATGDRRFESISLQRRVNKLSVPLTTAPVVRSHDPFAVERPVGRKGSDRQSAASDVRRSGRSRRTGFGLLPPWPQPVGTSSTCCAIARSANSASSPCTCRSERRRRVRAGQAV